MTTGTARDLSTKLQGRLAEVLERELHLFQHVLNPMEIGEVMFEAAVMVSRTTAATLAGYAGNSSDAEAIFRSVIRGIAESVRGGEADGLARTLAAMQARAA